jgi:hypothetical protein
VPDVFPWLIRLPTVAPLPGPVTAFGSDISTVDPLGVATTGAVLVTDDTAPVTEATGIVVE